MAALVALAAYAAYAGAGWFWIDLMDEGYFLYLASRVYGGDLPYRDFDTYYTPGIFYLHAATFKLFGVSVVPVRVVMAGVRVGCALLMYGLARRLVAWPYAILPPLLVAAVDAVPISPEPHPAWMALMATLLTAEMIARHQVSGRLRWVVLAGATAGLAFLFKQNVGAFAALAVGGYLMLRRRERVGWSVIAGQATFAAGLGLAVTVLLGPVLDTPAAATMWLPVPVALALLLRIAWRGVRPDGWMAGLRAAAAEGALAAAAFTGVTLAWLVPLTVALGPSATPFGLFIGQVNQGALVYPLDPLPEVAPGLALAAIWMPLGLSVLLRGRPRAWGRRTAGAALCLSLLVPSLPTGPLSQGPGPDPWLQVLSPLSTLYPYLPALGAWAGLAALALRAHGPVSPGPVPWYLLTGILAGLALYPRSDVPHAMFAGPLLFVVGAWALAQAHRELIGRAGFGRQLAVLVALLVVPAAAVIPHAYWRFATLATPDPRSSDRPAYEVLGLERAPILAPRSTAESVRGVVEFVRARTPPGEPLFAYPADPMFNFLADRPNPTRFDHFFPGALTPDDMAAVIASLEVARPRYVIWDDREVQDRQTDPANRPLSGYIWRCYDQVASYAPFAVLEHRGC